jgi:AcrR family transcriptional regulator/DNA-binding MarR family transcriptional regulator
VLEVQRGRLLAACAQIACEEGAANTTVARVVSRAGISRRTFYALFADCEECTLAAIDQALGVAREHASAAYTQTSGGWGAQVRAALVALLALFDQQPQVGLLLVVEWLHAGPAAARRRAGLIAELVEIVDRGQAQRRRGTGASPLAAEGVVGAVCSILSRHMLESAQKVALSELANPLMSIIVLPYLGAGAAQRELRRPAPRRKPRGDLQRSPAEVLQSAPIRFTHRTMLVLEALASNPGASNREVGDAAGVADQGQISKLLARLQKLGLIENHGRTPAMRGHANSWSLTAHGEQVERSLRV